MSIQAKSPMLNKTRLKSTRNKKLPSIAGTDGSDGLVEGESLPLQHIIDNPLNVQGDDCAAARISEITEGQSYSRIHELFNFVKIQDRSASCRG